ncbi:MAG: hypothetical protein ABI348_03835 [Nitrososphaera sp.]
MWTAAGRQAGVKYVSGAMLRMRDDIWDRMKLALRLLGVLDGERRYREIYGITEEPLARPYVACNEKYAKGVMDGLYEKVKSRGICPGFPDHVRPQDIDRSCTGQTTMLSFTGTSSDQAAMPGG